MTQVLFEPDTGRLRLDRETFGTLADWATGVHTAGPAMAELRAAGVLDDGQVHTTLAPGLAAVGQPVCRLRADMRDRDGAAETAEAWISGEAAAGMLLPLPDGMSEFITLASEFLPVILAQPVRATEDLIARLTGSDRDSRQAAVAELAQDAPDEPTREAMTALTSELRRDWAIRSAWQSPRGGLVGRIVRVLDTTTGLWLAQPQQNPAADVEAIWPTTPTTVWRYISRLRPEDDDLG